MVVLSVWKLNEERHVVSGSMARAEGLSEKEGLCIQNFAANGRKATRGVNRLFIVVGSGKSLAMSSPSSHILPHSRVSSIKSRCFCHDTVSILGCRQGPGERKRVVACRSSLVPETQKTPLN